MLTDTEIKIMHVIWSAKELLTAAEIIDMMNDTYNWKRSTTLTYLDRLINKKYLNRVKSRKNNRKCYVYYINVTEKQYKIMSAAHYVKQLYKNKEELINILEDL